MVSPAGVISGGQQWDVWLAMMVLRLPGNPEWCGAGGEPWPLAAGLAAP